VIAGAVLALAALALSGCTPGTASRPPEVPAEQLAVPPSMQRTQPYASVAGAILPAAGSAPYTFGRSIGAPGKPSSPAVWISDDGAEWEQRSVDSTFSGSFFGELAGDESLSALAGNAWSNAVPSTRLWISTDRSTWTSVKLPKGFATD